jgi:hypothetical protein
MCEFQKTTTYYVQSVFLSAGSQTNTNRRAMIVLAVPPPAALGEVIELTLCGNINKKESGNVNYFPDVP